MFRVVVRLIVLVGETMNSRELSNRQKRGFLVIVACVAFAIQPFFGCGDEGDDVDQTSPETMVVSRVGEPCQITSDCKEGLACLGGQQICVVLCEVGSEQCGEGIACQAAGSVGFCPPPAMPEVSSSPEGSGQSNGL